jgi:hypothetical protein
MAKHEKDLEALWGELARPGVRSSLFWWMLENHDTITKEAGGRKISWKRMCSHFEKLGLTDKTGRPASIESARLTWKRARKEKAHLAALAPKAEAKSASTAVAVSQANRPPPIPKSYWKSLAPPVPRPEDGTPIMPIGAKRWNDKYWLDEKNYIVGIDNLSWSLRSRQETYAIYDRNILEALNDVPALGPRIYFD